MLRVQQPDGQVRPPPGQVHVSGAAVVLILWDCPNCIIAERTCVRPGSTLTCPGPAVCFTEATSSPRTSTRPSPTSAPRGRSSSSTGARPVSRWVKRDSRCGTVFKCSRRVARYLQRAPSARPRRRPRQGFALPVHAVQHHFVSLASQLDLASVALLTTLGSPLPGPVSTTSSTSCTRSVPSSTG